ncbi:WhiB family transcriptional regulator [Streptomyces sp. NPDC000348]|uniref:WhiB family transcriptional regulator n=1 Tax=Streptomyces sp. NPDC000348 TaxID=3364538 RepID=UPI0036A642F2
MTCDRSLSHAVAGPSGAGREWLREAACVGEDPELFFPLVERDRDPQVMRARAVCRCCPVLLPCRLWAIRHGEDAGIWGATTAAQRRAIRRALLVERR